MTRLRWAEITSIIAIVYGLFLQVEAWLPAWKPIGESYGHNVVECIGGVILLGWGAAFFG